MANENENINPENAENNEEPKPHHTWLENIVENIQKLDTEFPLSGGETEEDFESVDDSEEEDADDDKGAKKSEEHHHTSFKDDLETEFPLSGGEVER